MRIDPPGLVPESTGPGEGVGNDVERFHAAYQHGRHDRKKRNREAVGRPSAWPEPDAGVWARIVTEVDGKWVQVERGARPQQAVFLPGAETAAYMAGQPVDDARFVPVFAHALEHTGSYLPNEAVRAAEALLPDVMPYDPARPACFPDNGRALSDDAADAFIAILTNGKLNGDGVTHHDDLLDAFPYLGPPTAPDLARAPAALWTTRTSPSLAGPEEGNR